MSGRHPDWARTAAARWRHARTACAAPEHRGTQRWRSVCPARPLRANPSVTPMLRDRVYREPVGRNARFTAWADAVDVGLEVDHPGDRHGLADPALGRVDRRAPPRPPCRCARPRSSPPPAARPGPRCSVLMWMTRSTRGSATRAASIAAHGLGRRRPRRAAGSWSRPPGRPPPRPAARRSRRVPMPSQTPSSVISVSADAEQREHQADQRGEVLEQHDRQLGRLGPADELHPGQRRRAPGWTR